MQTEAEQFGGVVTFYLDANNYPCEKQWDGYLYPINKKILAAEHQVMLPSDSHVLYLDGNVCNNDIDNLVVFTAEQLPRIDSLLSQYEKLPENTRAERNISELAFHHLADLLIALSNRNIEVFRWENLINQEGLFSRLHGLSTEQVNGAHSSDPLADLFPAPPDKEPSFYGAFPPHAEEERK